ncbi:MAG: hypothetical protein ABI696_18325 [Rubrivivax sp.]
MTLDPDVEALIKTAMRETGVPFKRVVNDALRKGFRQAPVRHTERFVQTVVDLGQPLIDVPSFNRLADELEDLGLVEKIRRG